MKIRFFLLLIIYIGLTSCRSHQQFVPCETTIVDSTSRETDLLIQRVQNLVNEIYVWEQRRDSTSTHDSVTVKDSTIVYVNNAGDVISKERFRDRVLKTEKSRSVESNKQTEIIWQYIDSLLTVQRTELMTKLEQYRQVPVPEERKLTKWEQVRQDVGGVSIGILVVVVVIAVIWLIKKIRNQK